MDCLKKPILVLAFLLIAASTLRAQGLNGPHASLTLNGQVASVVNPATHVVPVAVPGPFSLSIDSGPNPGAPFALLGRVAPTGGPPVTLTNNIPTPWGESIDLVDPVVILDGLGAQTSLLDSLAVTNQASQFTVAFSDASGLTDMSVGFQAIVFDPTSPVFPYDNTEAGIAAFAAPLIVTTYTQTYGPTFHQLTVPISFYGQTYTAFYVNENGNLTFSSPAQPLGATASDLFDGLGVAPNPAVALFLSDFETLSGSRVVTEDPVAQSVRVDYENQVHWDSHTSAGDFCVLFSPGSITLDFGAFIPGQDAGDSGSIGVSDGDGSIGINTDPSNGFGTGLTLQLPYASPSAPDSIIEEIPADTLPGSLTYTFLEVCPGKWVVL